ncbi:MAG: Ig-like domain-containing protein [Bacteroidota bacterium]|nr:Ig-like domain-containing protein [Bacteroidota bacterium]
MMRKTRLLLSLLLVGSMATLLSCSKDDEGSVAVLTITSISATGTDITTGNEATKDLNAAASAADVPPDATFVITFDRAVDPASATTSTITIANGGNNVPATVTTSGNVVTVAPTENLVQGTTYTLSVGSSVKASDGGVFTSTTRTFTTSGRAPAVVPQVDNLVVYIPFNGEVTEELGHTVLNKEIGFAADRFGNFEAAGDFNGTTNYVGIQYSEDMNNPSTTVSYWMKLPASEEYTAHIGSTATGVTRYVTFSIGGNNGTFHEFNRFTCCDLGYDIDVLNYVTNHVNSGSASDLAASFIEMKNEGNPGGEKVIEVNNVGWLEEQTGEWVHIVTSWNAATRRKAFYINGVPSTVYELTPSEEYALDNAIIDVAGIDADPTNNANLYLGSGVPFWASIEGNGITPFRGDKPFAFKGQMDDFRMFSIALSDAEVLVLYNAERP